MGTEVLQSPRVLPTESPLISHDFGSGITPVSRPRIVREEVKISRLFAIPSKPGLCPESEDSPVISAGREILSPERRGGIAQSISRRKSG